MIIISRIIRKMRRIYDESSSPRYIAMLRKQGIKIGDNVLFVNPSSTLIDVTRPCLVSIGNDVRFNRNFQLLTHDFSTAMFRVRYGDFVNSSGAVSIGNNVWFGTNVTVLKGVSIGDNCIIGAGSLVTHSILPGMVAAGVPCKAICSIKDYYTKRKQKGLAEAKEYVRCFRSRNHQDPTIDDLWEEFIWFVDSRNIYSYPPQFQDVIRRQIGSAFDSWLKNHKAPFSSLEEFLDSCK